ncbi:hypothetical protein QWY28_00700 [Nocardioides sp. SOB77]|uniref:PknH-like extracellular domain-containing protein n=1 Tax=Nocardioides oceani TaxID=3058369 RepID=A0ABT8F9U1_9ACTN|nr:hypothetical protein [Nocardioides oceani]MDN4171453.1 hypothetical protein [Nocardioides oceani]
MSRLPRALRAVRRRPLLAPAALALVLTVSACGGDPDAAPAPATSPSTSTPTAGATPGPTTSPATSATPGTDPTTTPSTKPGGGKGRPNRTLAPLPAQPLHARAAGDHLLDASRMPALSEDRPWAEVADGRGGAPVGACQEASLFDIGALRTTGRRFATADGSTTATQVVGRFPDAKSAWRATEVLLAWRADCAERLDHARTAVGEVRDVPVRTGTGAAYPASWGPRSATGGRATGLGILRTGSWVSVVEIATDEGGWPRGWDPARQAVRRIAKTFPG